MCAAPLSPIKNSPQSPAALNLLGAYPMIPPISHKFSCDCFLTHADLSIQIKQRLNIRFDGVLNQRSFDVKVKRTTAAKTLIGAVLGAAAIFAAPAQAKDWKTVTIALEGG